MMSFTEIAAKRAAEEDERAAEFAAEAERTRRAAEEAARRAVELDDFDDDIPF